ncbi:MAG: hypothetical protein ACP5QA_06510 [Phycisphaerae bacterium]
MDATKNASAALPQALIVDRSVALPNNLIIDHWSLIIEKDF